MSAAEASVAQAQLNLSYTKIYSPLDGRVGLASSKIGALVGRGEPTLLATVSLTDPIYVSFSASERGVYEVRRARLERGITTKQDQLWLLGGIVHRAAYNEARAAGQAVVTNQTLLENSPLLGSIREDEDLVAMYSFVNTLSGGYLLAQDKNTAAYDLGWKGVDDYVSETRKNGFGAAASATAQLAPIGKLQLGENVATGLPVINSGTVTIEQYQAAQKVLTRTSEILPQLGRSAGFGETYAVAIVRVNGQLKTVISHVTDYGVKGVALKEGEILVGRGSSIFDAESKIYEWAGQQNAEILSIGATRPMCPSCRATATSLEVPIATPIKR